MKKKLFLSLMLMTVAVGYTTAQEVIATVPAQAVVSTNTGTGQEVVTLVPAQVAVIKTPTACEFTPVSHWSFGIKGGTNYFRVAPGVSSRSDEFHLIVGGNLEYSINPLVGLGVEYMYNPYGHPYQLNATQTGTLEGYTHDADIYASVNLMNLLVPNRIAFWSKMDIYGDAGVGVGFYQFKLSDASGNVIVDSRNGGDGVPETPMAKLGLNLEYNISKSLAFGGEVQYRYYDRANLGGYSMTKGNSDALTATIGLKFKFGANGNKQHARNISMCEYYPKPAPVIIEKIIKDNTIETINRLNALETENDSINRRNQRLSDEMKVLSYRNNKPATTVIVQNNDALSDKIQKLENDLKALSAKNKGVVNASFDNIEFELGSDKLTSNSFSTLDRIADVLVRNPGWAKLNVAGHTDSSGSAKFNLKLSRRRANSVKNYLLDKNVPSASISVSGYGEDRPIASNNTSEGRQKNRRVEFQISK
ncbi:MAG: OmpA family protein [Paludibacter sp.]|nr:OmpA family protein [Paludibacter sp.]